MNTTRSTHGRLILTAAILTIFVNAPARAQTSTPAGEFVTTQHELDIGNRTIRYSAHAGLLPLVENDTGKLMAQVFVIAYIADRKRGEPVRPLTFTWNGGPGSSSSELHVIGFGPKGLLTPSTFPEWVENPPTEIVDRADTWLADSDLVFVDPVGTGYSRATSVENRDILYTTRGDIEAVAETIRLYRTRFDAWDAPIFIAGESYGTTRAMGVAEALQRRRTNIAGVILISGFYDAGQEVPAALASALQMPMYTAAAHYHGRLAPDLQQASRDSAMQAAETWAREDYAPALQDLDSLTSTEHDAVVAGIERFSGVAAEFIDQESLLLSKEAFADHLLEDQQLELGHYDLRMTRSRRASGTGWLPTRDPSLAVVLDLMQGTSVPLIRYLRDTLGYRSDLLYRGPFGEAFHPRPLVEVTGGAFGDMAGIYNDWMSVMWNQGAFTRDEEPEAEPKPPARPPLERAMEMNPDFLVWNVKGIYDGSCALLDEAVARTAQQLQSRIRNSCHDGGHMIYTDTAVRQKMQREFSQFVRDALAMP